MECQQETPTTPSEGAAQKHRYQGTRGATALEYALIGSLIAVVVIAGIQATGQETGNLYNRVAAAFK